MESFKNIFNVLDLTKKNGLFILSENEWQGQCKFSKRVEHLIQDVLKPYAFFYFNETPFIFFFDNPDNIAQLHQQIWNFNQTPVIFIQFENQYHIYNGFSFIKDKGKKELAILANFDKDLNDFNYFEIVTGETWEKYQQKLQVKQRVDYQLLNNIKTLRNQLTSKTANFAKIANSLIGRILFIRYLIDRKVRIKNRLWTNEDLCEVLESVELTYELFEYLQSKDNYNGDLFPLEKAERNTVKEIHLQKIIQLLKGTDLEKGQLSLFDIYDFSIIPIELVSNVYEYFIGKDNQILSSAYYTPLFLVNYVLNQTVGEYFQENEKLYNCKILDPACGSGIFLVESLRKIIWRYKANHKGCEENKELYHKQLKKLLQDNIFGIDIDSNAINVAIFSLYITLLDFIEKPADIEGFKFPNLLNKNFFIADFFDTNASYNQSFEKKDFIFIVGNPPWGKIPNKEGNFLYEDYWRRREKAETKLLKEQTKDNKKKVRISVARKEIAQAFLIRTKDFSVPNTKCALIVTSKVLYNLYSNHFRQYFLRNNLVHQIFELSSVRHEVFDKSNDPAIAPASIIFYSSSIEKYISKNLIRHISLKPNRFFELFKLFVIEKFDDKKIPQKTFIEYDWLWKTLVYGNILDFYFIKRLAKSQDIYDIISNKERFVFGKGVCINGGDENPIEHLKAIELGIDTKKKSLQPFFIQYSDNFLKELSFVHRPRNPDLYRGPFLLIKKGFTNDFKVVSAISTKDAVFTDSVTSIKAKFDKDISVLRQIGGIFYSNLFSYFLIMRGSSSGIEREQLHDKKEKFSFPLKMDKVIPELVKSVEDINQDIYQYTQNPLINLNSNLKGSINTLENQKIKLLKELNYKLFKLYQLSNQEVDLVDYSSKVTLQYFQDKKNYNYTNSLNLDNNGKEFLKNYAQIIVNHFNHLFQEANKKIQINIYHSKYTIGVEFCVVDKSDNKLEYNFIADKDSKSMLNKFALLSYDKLSEELFIQKDIKGFEEESFYVIKPNEYKCWHRAIGHLDLGEFLEATLKAGAKQKRAKHYAQ